jgi:hypothetical protein
MRSRVTTASCYNYIMVESLKLEKCGPIRKLVWEDVGRLNLILGVNDTGKSILAKLIYAVLKAEEEYLKGIHKKSTWTEHLNLKLGQVLIPAESILTNLIQFKKSLLSAVICTNSTRFAFKISRTTGRASTGETSPSIRTAKDIANIVFVPTKEVFSLFEVINHTREIWTYPAFDDTYKDLVDLLAQPLIGRGAFENKLDESYRGLLELVNGEFLFGSPGDDIAFIRGGQSIHMSLTAEGIKRIGMLTQLIRNGTIIEGSTLFIDEPEVNLHPKATRILIKFLFELASRGVQVFMTTHDYFVIKQCEIQARKWEHESKVCVLRRKQGQVQAEIADLREGIPENEIVDESIDMLNEDLSSRLQ